MLTTGTDHFCFYGPKGGQGTSTVAAVFALWAARLGANVALRTHDRRGLAGLLAVPRREGAPLEVTRGVSLSDLGHRPVSPVVVDDLGCGHHGVGPHGATRALVIRPCYLALDAAVAALDRQPRPDALVVVSEPNRALGPSDLADALASPVAAVVPLDPTVARAVDAGGLVHMIGRSRAPQSLQPLLDLAGRWLDGAPDIPARPDCVGGRNS